MNQLRGFPPISRPDAHTLILGSMPSSESLAQQRYYAHPRNSFWPIICDLLLITASGYEERAKQVTGKGIAVWDVLKACFRAGSLDSAIDDRTIVTNDFSGFFREHPLVSRVFFNGAKAETLYLRHVLPGLSDAAAPGLQRLPSTSPANAGMSLAQKTAAWRMILGEGLK
jgi:hypoxanthine-DNA glycosylase